MINWLKYFPNDVNNKQQCSVYLKYIAKQLEEEYKEKFYFDIYGFNNVAISAKYRIKDVNGKKRKGIITLYPMRPYYSKGKEAIGIGTEYEVKGDEGCAGGGGIEDIYKPSGIYLLEHRLNHCLTRIDKVYEQLSLF